MLCGTYAVYGKCVCVYTRYAYMYKVCVGSVCMCGVYACGQLCGVCAWVRCVVCVCGVCGMWASMLGDGRDWPSSLAQQFEYRSFSIRSQLSVTRRPCSVFCLSMQG